MNKLLKISISACVLLIGNVLHAQEPAIKLYENGLDLNRAYYQLLLDRYRYDCQDPVRAFYDRRDNVIHFNKMDMPEKVVLHEYIHAWGIRDEKTCRLLTDLMIRLPVYGIISYGRF